MSNQQGQALQNPQPSGVFISYSHRDRSYLDELKAQLRYYEREGLVSYWDDTKILPGAEWLKEIKKALQSAKIAILLVSADFLASNFIADIELSFLLNAQKEGLLILSVIVRPCLFDATPMSKFQTINPPDQPLSSMSKTRREEVWVKLSKFIKANLK